MPDQQASQYLSLFHDKRVHNSWRFWILSACSVFVPGSSTTGQYLALFHDEHVHTSQPFWIPPTHSVLLPKWSTGESMFSSVPQWMHSELCFVRVISQLLALLDLEGMAFLKECRDQCGSSWREPSATLLALKRRRTFSGTTVFV